MNVRLYPNFEEIDSVCNEIISVLEKTKWPDLDVDSEKWGDWGGRFEHSNHLLFNSAGHLNKFLLRNFIGLGEEKTQIATYDMPNYSFMGYFFESSTYYILRKILDRVFGQLRKGILEAGETYSHVVQEGFLPLLKSFPMPTIGNPSMTNGSGLFNPFSAKNGFTNRYIRHIYQLATLEQNLPGPLSGGHVDIGSSYGLCSSLIKRRYPDTKHVLIDKTSVLIAAYFYLRCLFPDARIHLVKENDATESLRSIVNENDFTLYPADFFEPTIPFEPELVTNFYSFGEMPRYWLERYCDSELMKRAKFFYTVNRYDSRPSYTSDITFLDYPFDLFEPLSVRTCPVTNYHFEAKMMFFTRKVRYSSEFFEFIGVNKKHGS